MGTFAQALTALAQGIKVKRKGWLNDWYVVQGTTNYGLSVFFRHQGEEVMLWSRATADDVTGEDWRSQDGGDLPEASCSGGFLGVLPVLLSGRSIRRRAWKKGMSVSLEDVEGLSGRRIIITLPNGQKKATEFGPAELFAPDWET